MAISLQVDAETQATTVPCDAFFLDAKIAKKDAKVAKKENLYFLCVLCVFPLRPLRQRH